MLLPLVEELSPPPDVIAALRALADLPGAVLFDSALVRPPIGRYSFLAADPFATFVVERAAYGSAPFGPVREALQRYSAASRADLPPFQGGAAGLLGYELGGAWERLPRAAVDEFEFPERAIGLYDWVVAWDRVANRCWIVSQGFPETDRARREQRARDRLAFVRERLKKGDATLSPDRSGACLKKSRVPFSKPVPAPGLERLASSFSRDEYLRAVERVIEYIHAGDIFQANLSQRLLYPQEHSPLDLYARLRERNPAPFAGYLAHDDWAIASASPERFVSIREGEVETRPIKGTRQRRTIPEADLFTRDELRQSAKDQAENVMIVDLLRNDLSRVCRPGSVRVPTLCTVETYQTVQHLVSEVRGRLREGCETWDLLEAAFPGGSITGAPKIRAMEIIAELEPTVRGPYCGSLFYVGFDGTADSSILIRTFTCRRGWVQCPVGGGIVAQSDPRAEYEETLHKAEGMLRALR
ncbi:MAG TPA: aminodeoxychorismate synthase component I [Planctomycetaceae bacterium]|nr:aminodeoxychorismate synthase component I [Planctomycetaceae bacterium]